MASGSTCENNNKYDSCQDYNGNTQPNSLKDIVKQLMCNESTHLEEYLVNGDDVRQWCCTGHPHEIAKMFCSTHDAFVCETCFSVDHGMDCDLHDVFDAVTQRKEDMARLVEEGKKREEEMGERSRRVGQFVVKIKEHFAKEESRLKKAYGDEVKKLTDRFGLLMRDLKEGSLVIREKVDKQRDDTDKVYKELAEMRSKAEELARDDDMMMKEYTKLTRLACSKFDEDLTNTVSQSDHAFQVAMLVNYVREDGLRIGEINMPVERWELDRKFGVGQNGYSGMIGSSSCGEVVIKNSHNATVHALDILEGKEKRVIESKNSHDMWRCSSLQDGRIVGGSCDGDVVVFDQTWKHIRTISVVLSPSARVFVSVNDDGNVLASAVGQSSISIINPDSGEIVRSIVVVHKAIYEVHAMANSNIAIRTKCSRGQDVCVVNQDGSIISNLHLHTKDMRSMAVDRSRDALFVLYQVSPLNFAIDVMTFGRATGARKIVECSSTPFSPTFVLLEPSKLVVHNEGKILLYKKTNRGLGELLDE